MPVNLTHQQKIMNQHNVKRMTRERSRRTQQPGLSLVELVVSMGLMSLIMMPVIGLMATSYKVYNASSTTLDGGYARQVALDSAAMRLQFAQRVLAVGTNFGDVQMASGATARLSISGTQLTWTEGGTTQILVSGLSSARFSVGAAGRATATAGELLLIEVGSRAPGDPLETWSSTQLWIKPTL